MGAQPRLVWRPCFKAKGDFFLVLKGVDKDKDGPRGPVNARLWV